MSKKEPAPRAERSPFVQDAILRETVRKEGMFQKDFTEFHPSFDMLREATPDKPLVSSFCSNPHIYDDDDDEELRKTLHVTTREIDDDPHSKYSMPMTTSQEIGWDAREYSMMRKSMFDHRHKKTDVTTLPSKWDPAANVMKVQSKPPK